MSDDPHYRRPGWLTRNVLNRATAAATSLGIDVAGARVLEARGRKSGQPRSTPVNLLHHGGSEYLVAARGETEWVRNVRADGGRLVLRLGRRRRPYVASELFGDDALPVLQAYVARWRWEVGAFFEGVGPGASDDAWRAELVRHPVFELAPA